MVVDGAPQLFETVEQFVRQYDITDAQRREQYFAHGAYVQTRIRVCLIHAG